MNTSGLLLFAHGARDPQWAKPFEAVVACLGLAQPELKVGLAYLEFMLPNLSTAGTQLVQQGCTHVSVVPLFLGAGGHVRKDLPLLLEALQAQHPRVQWRLCPAIGEMQSVVQAMAHAALAQVSP
jgi:sirohydrochlorin cobaltochelatase